MANVAAQSDGSNMGEGGKQIRLPKQNINNEWFVGTIEVIKKMDFVLSTLTRVDDPRVEIMARQVINRVLDDKTRWKLLDAFDAKLKEIDNMKDAENKPASSTEQHEERIRVSQDFVGEVNGYLDEALALHKGQEIGEV
jgi:hypothetical protein